MSDVLITPASKKIEFKDASSNIDGTIKLDTNDNLVLTTANDLVLGDGATDLHIGDGTNSIDVVYDQSGRLYGAANKDITIGKSSVGGNDIIIDSPNWSVAQAGTAAFTGSLTVDYAGSDLYSDIIGPSNRDLRFVLRDNGDGDSFLFRNAAGTTLLDVNRTGEVIVSGVMNVANLKIGGGQGSDGQVLTSTGSGVAWEAASGGGGGGASTLNDLTDVLIASDSFIVNNMGSAPTTGTLSSAVNNVAIGDAALDALTSGTNNIAFGDSALGALTTGVHNVALGNEAMLVGNGSNNVAIGQACVQNVTGDTNIGIGLSALAGATSGTISAYDNIAIGENTMPLITSGHSNIAIGKDAGFAVTTGDYNIMIGHDAGDSLQGGNENILIGRDAGQNITSGSDNVIIGKVDAGSATGSDQLVIASGDGGVHWIRGDSSGNLGFPTDATNSPTIDFSSGGGISVAHATQANVQVYDTSSSSNKTDFAQSGSDTYIVNRSTSGSIFLRMGNGSTNKQVKLTNNGHMQFYSNHSSGDKVGLQFIRNDTTTGGSDYLGGISWDSVDGNVPSSIDEGSAYIAAYAVETHSATAKGGRIEIGTAGAGTAEDTVSTAHLRIDHGGGRILGTPVTGLSSNTTLTRASHAGKWLNITSAGITVTLPQATVEGEQYCILNNNGGTTTVGRATSVTINGASSNKTLTTQYQMKVYMALGTGASTNYIEIGA